MGSLWEAGDTVDHQGGPGSERRNTFGIPASPGHRQPNLILLIGSWGDSKELLDSPSSGPGIPFCVTLAD